MPFVTIQQMAGTFTADQTRTLIRDITDAYVKIGGEGVRPHVTVVVNEVPDGAWAIGGEVKTLAMVEADRATRVG